MVRAGVRCEAVYSFYSGRVLSVLRIVSYNLETLRVAVFTPYGTCIIPYMVLWITVGRSVLASVGRALCSYFVGVAAVVLLPL